ncbi:WXG100 family type VII secretion target [Nocardia vinacea]|uniref:WXG100 family type VII secretion target n=1 Tax=Nocardia vinacea TaxID=96468 RepID=UPI0002D3741F|nr:WXG100 family type VII secretion target [Nocardia vinacea]
MGERFSADGDRLRDLAPHFDHIGADVLKAVKQLRDTLAHEGEPWGDDDAGRAFADSYLPERQRTMSDLDSLVQVLQQSGSDLRQLAANFESLDLDNAKLINNLANQTSNEVVPQLSTNGTLVPQLRTGATTMPPPTRPSAIDAETANGAPHANEVATTPTPTPTGTAVPTGASSSGSQQPGRSARDERGVNPTDANVPGSGARPSAGGPSRSGDQAVSGIDAARQAEAARERARAEARAAAAAAVANKSSTAAPSTTPWSKGGSGGPPKVSAPGSESSAPRMPGRPVAKPPVSERKSDKSKAGDSPESLAARLARELAERHGVRAFGFESPGVGDDVLTQLVAAVDDVLPEYPKIDLRAIGIDELPDGELTRLEWDSDPGPDGPVLFTARIVLGLWAATDPEYLAQTIAGAERGGMLARGCAQRPVYSSIVRELGGALDVAGGFRARVAAHRALVTAYLPLLASEERGSLSRTVSGFRAWRSRLSGRSFHRGRFEPAAALAEAFTEVVMTKQAVPPAQVLHQVLVVAAESVGR